MFHSRRAHPDIKKTTQKFLDPKKESHARLRALRTLLGMTTTCIFGSTAVCFHEFIFAKCTQAVFFNKQLLFLHLRLLRCFGLQGIFSGAFFGDILRVPRCVLPGGSKPQAER